MSLTYPPHIYAAEKVASDEQKYRRGFWDFCLHPHSSSSHGRALRAAVADDIRHYLATGEARKRTLARIGKPFCAELLAALEKQAERDRKDEAAEARNRILLITLAAAVAVALCAAIATGVIFPSCCKP